VVTAVQTDAAAEGVGARAAWWLLALPALGTVTLAATLAYRPLYFWLLRDDHVIEWLQFAVCLFTAAAAALSVPQLLRRRRWMAVALLAVVALGALGLALEEISWGQRIIGFTGGIVADNRQHEFNVHNIDSKDGVPIEDIFRFTEMGMGLAGAALPFLTRWRPARLRGEFWRLLSPPLFLAPWFLIMFGYRFVRYALPGVRPPAVVAFQEWTELCLYGGLAISATLIYVRARRAAADTATHQAAAHQLVTSDPAAAAAPLVWADIWGLVPAGLIIAAATVLFAVLTMMSGIEPGNV
jgi:hypothetical protein